MARNYLMSWDGKNRRWLKEYRNKKYSVSCRQLDCPENKEASYQLANAWWTRKKQEIDAAARPAPRSLLPLEDLAAATVGKRDLTNLSDVLEILSRKTSCEPGEIMALLDGFMRTNPPPEDPEQMRRDAIRVAVNKLAEKNLVEGEPLPEEFLDRLPPARAQQVKRSITCFRGEPADQPERTVSAHIERWLGMRQAKVSAGERSAKAEDNFRIHLNYFKDYVGGQADVASVNAQTVEGYYLWCLKKITERRDDLEAKAGWSHVYAAKAFAIARQFIKFLARTDAIEQLPRNLDSPDHRFDNGPGAIKTWTVPEFKAALAAATGQTPLHLLLMANCGMTQKDISDLQDKEVDWDAGRIIRKRSKTAKHKDVPVVNYLLWPATFALLKEHRSGEARVLLTESGQPWVWQELVNGKKRGSDNFRSNFTHLIDKLKPFNKPPKQLRKTSASLLDSNSEFSRYSTLFLGHSPRSIADRHYVHPSQDRFDAAVLWLGERFGQVGLEAGRPAKGK